MTYLRLLALPFLTLLIGLGAGAYGFRLYIGSLSFDSLEISSDSLLQVDHSPFQAILDRHLKTEQADGINKFDYRNALADRDAVAAYVAGLEAIDPADLNSEEALAYWLNFYNAGMIHLILQRGEFHSVFDDRVYHFLTDHFEVAGQALSLDKIENQVIRVLWDEPRIHYGLNCASLSCPNLQPIAFSGDTLDTQLDAAAYEYINHPRGVAGLQGRRVVVSEIFEWFKEDFGGSDRGIIDHIAQYAEGDLAADLSDARRVRTQTYDWTLNIVTN